MDFEFMFGMISHQIASKTKASSVADLEILAMCAEKMAFNMESSCRVLAAGGAALDVQ